MVSSTLGECLAPPRVPLRDDTMISSRLPDAGRYAGSGLASLRVRHLLEIVLKSLFALSLLAALVALGSTSVPALFGLKTMIVTSGSMGPTIGVGDAVVLSVRRSVSDIDIGDVVTFRAGERSGMVTHRVIATKEIQGKTYYQTQGDANPSPDPDLTAFEAVYGEARVTLPRVGILLHFAQTPLGKLSFVVFPLAMLMARELRDLFGGRGLGTEYSSGSADTDHG